MNLLKSTLLTLCFLFLLTSLIAQEKKKGQKPYLKSLEKVIFKEEKKKQDNIGIPTVTIPIPKIKIKSRGNIEPTYYFSAGANLMRLKFLTPPEIKQKLLPISLSLDRTGFWGLDGVSVGASTALSRYDYYDYYYPETIHITLFSFSVEIGVELFSLIKDIKPSFEFTDRVDIYAHIQGGYDFFLVSDDYAGALLKGTYVGFNVGSRIFLTKNIGIFAEFGRTDQGRLTVGLTTKFKDKNPKNILN